MSKAVKVELMKSLADQVGATYDGGDNRLFYDAESITVYCNLLDKKQYVRMEKEIARATVKRVAYTVHAWNDASGFEYWHNGGKTGDSNYIQVTVEIKNAAKVRTEQLKRDLDSVFSSLCHWHNVDEYYRAEMDKREEQAVSRG